MNKCLNCGEKTKNKKFCSTKCAIPFVTEKKIIFWGNKKKEWVKEYLKNPTKCKTCKKNIHYDKRKNIFCSHSCAASFNNLGNRKHGEEPGNCLFCDEKLKNSYNKFCNLKCFHDFNHKEYIKRWLDGKENGRGAETVSAHVRKYLYEKNGEKCSRCGWKERNNFTNRIPLHAHHKDGNWKNNVLNNLEILCPNCHSLTYNFGVRNKERIFNEDSN